MKVTALEMGFFGGRRVRAGQEFDVPEGTKGTWFAPSGETKAPAAKGGKAKKEPETLSGIAKAPVVSPEKDDDLV